MNVVTLKRIDDWTADVYVGSKWVGTADDCGDRWIIQCEGDEWGAEPGDTDHLNPLTGAYEARTLNDLAFAISECVNDVLRVDIEK